MEDVINAALTRLQASHKIEIIEGVPHVLSHKDIAIRALPDLLERIAPTRITRTVTAHDVRGFVDVVNTYKHPTHENVEGEAMASAKSRIYVGPFEKAMLEARLDDIQPGVPSYVTHKVSYACPLTREWKTWIEHNTSKKGQVEFAEFLEANLVDIVEPRAADLLAATLDFSNSQKGEFASAARLSDGSVQFKWSQDNTGMAARFPERIKLGLRVYEGLDVAYTLEARLKFRLNNGALTLWYELDRPDIVQRAAYEKLLALVGEQTGLQVFRAL